MDNGAKLTAGWSDAYEVDFTQGGGNGDRPIVLSYDSSPAFTVERRRAAPRRRCSTPASARSSTPACSRVPTTPRVPRRSSTGCCRPRCRRRCPTSMYVFPVDAGDRAAGRVGDVRRPARRAADARPRRDRREPRRLADDLERRHLAMRPNIRLARLLLVAAVPLAILGVFFVLPVAGMISTGFWTDGAFDPAGVLEVLGRPRVHRVLWFTLWSATLGTLLSLALGLPAAHVLYRRRVLGAEGAARGAAGAVRAADGGGRRRLPRARRRERPARLPRPRRHPGRDHRRPGVLQRLGRDPRGGWRLGVARPSSGRGRRCAGREPRPGAADGHAARSATGDRVGGHRGVPVLRHGLRRRAHPGRPALQLGGDRDLPAHHQPARPPGGGRPVGAAAAGGRPVCCSRPPARVVRRTRRSPGSWPVRGGLDPGRRSSPGARDGPAGAAGRRADPRARRRLAAQRRRLEPGQLPRPGDDRRAAGAARAGHRGAGHLAAHCLRRHLDVPAARPLRRGASPPGVRGRRPSAGCARCSTGCSCCPSGSRR